MLIAIEPRNDLVTSENQLERLYLIRYLMELKESIDTQPLSSVSTEQLTTIKFLLKSGQGHYEGNYINFPSLDTAEIYSLISKSLTTEQIFKHSFKENITYLLQVLDRLQSINEKEKFLLVDFLSNLISNLNVQNTQNTRNFFDW